MDEGALGTRTVTQVSIVVPDVERAVEAWSAVLGTPPSEQRESNPADQAKRELRYHGEPLGGRTRIAFFYMDNVDLEIIEPVGGPNTWQTFLDRRGAGGHHIAFVVDEAMERLERLRELGYPTEQTGIRRVGARYGYADTTALIGAYLELLGNPRRSPVPAGADLDAWKREVDEWLGGTEQRRLEARALPDGGGIGTRRVEQVGFVVPSVERAAAEVAALLGVEPPAVRSTNEVELGPVTYRGQRIEGACRWALMPVEESMVIELIEPADEPSTWRETLDGRGPCMHHLGFEVPDEAAAVRHLEGLGYAQVQRGTWEGGSYTNFATREALGIDIEVLGRGAVRP